MKHANPFIFSCYYFIADTRLNINKELPTTKWRRDRRNRLSAEYHSHEVNGIIKPLGESNQSNSNGPSAITNSSSSNEIPLDMTVTSVSKPIPQPPPPPYREPLPGSTFLNAAISPNTSMARPSVITQAPRREIIANQENKDSFKKANNSYAASTTGMSSSLPCQIQIVERSYPSIFFLFFLLNSSGVNFNG